MKTSVLPTFVGALFAAALAQQACAASRDVQRLTLTVGTLERECLLHVPADLPQDKDAPLVFVFHGGSGTAQGTMNLSKFNAVADREKFLVAYPQGLGRSWNDGRVTQVSQAHREHVEKQMAWSPWREPKPRRDRLQSTGLFRYARRRSELVLVARRRNLLSTKGFHLFVSQPESGCKKPAASVL